MLDISLRDFLKQRGFRGLSLIDSVIKSMSVTVLTFQLATALAHLKSAGITHSDLKPDNIMMVDHVWQPLKVKIIDFGSAFETSGARSGSYIQTRWYRSPEVMLGLPYTEAIDVWSLGCVAAELFLGQPLYPGRNEYEMVSLQLNLFPSPSVLIGFLFHSLKYMKLYVLKYSKRKIHKGLIWAKLKLLQLDANQRITPRQLLQHPFISMSHLQELIPHRPK
uniref:Protein kinase domain-containing protein n=1 Tax=Myripristis murdjan TaxID=586833 RepID=A0A668AR81_9TELE